MVQFISNDVHHNLKLDLSMETCYPSQIQLRKSPILVLAGSPLILLCVCCSLLRGARGRGLVSTSGHSIWAGLPERERPQLILPRFSSASSVLLLCASLQLILTVAEFYYTRHVCVSGGVSREAVWASGVPLSL